MHRHHFLEKEYINYIDAYAQTDIFFGDGAIPQLGEHLLLDNNHFAFLVSGGNESTMTSGAYPQFVQMTLNLDIEVPLYRNVPPEPDVETVRSIVEDMKKYNPTVVVALGGGSVLDAAKAAYLSWQSGMDVTELFGVNKASDAFPEKKFDRVICLPTTAGTGSEVTPYSNIVDREADVKRLIVDTALIPEYAFVDPGFTLAMPESLTISTALDAMSHLIESLLNTKAKNASPDTEKWALEGIKLILTALPKVKENPKDLLSREMLSAASVLGGMCIKNRPTGLPHLCSFSFYGKVPHGLAVATLLPPFWRFYLEEEDVRKATMKLACIFTPDIDNPMPEDVLEAYVQFLKRMTGTGKLRDLTGFDKKMIERIASDAKENTVKLQTAPRSVDTEKAQEILSRILTESL